MTCEGRWRRLAPASFGAVVILVILAACGGSPAATDQPSSNSSKSAGPAAKTVAGPVADVRLNLLKSARAAAAETGRDPFRFVQKAPPPGQARAVTATRPVVAAPAAPAGPPPPPPIPLKFIGILEAARAGKVALLSDGRGNVEYGREGDIIEGRYQVLKIGTESIDLAYADGRGRQTIRLSGQ